MNIADLLVQRREFAVTAGDVIEKGYMRFDHYEVYLKDSPLQILTLTQRKREVTVYNVENKMVITPIIVCDAWVMDTAVGSPSMVTLRPEQMLSLERA